MQLMAKTAKIIPTTKEPVSPINILAGKVLNFKNPTKAPDNVKAIKAISVCSIIKAIPPNERDEIKPIPPAKPSMPKLANHTPLKLHAYFQSVSHQKK